MTKEYKMHPQLGCFKASKNPSKSINVYLKYIADEADTRVIPSAEKRSKKTL